MEFVPPSLGEQYLRGLAAEREDSRAAAQRRQAERQARIDRNNQIIYDKVGRLGEMTSWLASEIKRAPDVYIPGSGARGWALVHTDPHDKEVDDGQSPLSPKWTVHDTGGGTALLEDGDTIVHYQGYKHEGQALYTSSLGSGRLAIPPSVPALTATKYYFVPNHCAEELNRTLLDLEHSNMHTLAGWYESLVLELAANEGLV